MNRPLQVYMDEEDLARLESWSRRRGWTKSRAIRAAVRFLTREPGADPLLDASGTIEGLPANLSAELDRYLAETYGAKAPSRAAGRRKQPGPRIRR